MHSFLLSTTAPSFTTSPFLFKGYNLYLFSGLHYSCLTPVEQSHTLNYPKYSIRLRKTAYLDLCLQPSVKFTHFSFLLNMMRYQ